MCIRMPTSLVYSIHRSVRSGLRKANLVPDQKSTPPLPKNETLTPNDPGLGRNTSKPWNCNPTFLQNPALALTSACFPRLSSRPGQCEGLWCSWVGFINFLERFMVCMAVLRVFLGFLGWFHKVCLRAQGVNCTSSAVTSALNTVHERTVGLNKLGLFIVCTLPY